METKNIKDIDFIEGNFEMKNPSKERFRFLIFKSVKNIDILVTFYSTPITSYYNNSITYISLFDMNTKGKIREYKSQSVRNLEHYCFNNQDLLININDRNAIIIYDIEKEKHIKIIDEPGENYYEDFMGRDLIFEMNYCPFFIQDGKINLITSCISDKFVKLWDYDSCKLLKKVEGFEFTFCTRVFTDNNNNYLIATNENLTSYTLPDFQVFKHYFKFSKFERRKFLIENINNVPFIFVFDHCMLKIFDFYSGNLYRNIKFQLSLNLCNFILWDNEHLICCDDDWVWGKSGLSFLYNLTSNTILPCVKGYNFIKYEFNNTKSIFYNNDQLCIKNFEESEFKVFDKSKPEIKEKK